jgi:hypothetical protein
MEAKGDQRQIQFAKVTIDEMRRQGHVGYNKDSQAYWAVMGFELDKMDANPMRWYHGTLDVNTSADAARAMVALANRYRKNIDYIEVPNIDHYAIQDKMYFENMAWLLK